MDTASGSTPAVADVSIYSEYNEPEGLYFLYDDGQGGVTKMYEDGHSSNDEGDESNDESNDDDTSTGLNPTIANVSFLNPTVTKTPALHPFGSWP